MAQPWAKIDQDRTGRVVEFHHLTAHALDVAAVMERLLANTVIRRALAAAGGVDDLTPLQRARLCVPAALHDVAKLNAGFYCRAEPADWAGKPGHASHLEEAFALFEGQPGQVFAGALDLQQIAGWSDGQLEGFSNLLIAALSHHGLPLGIPGPARVQQLAQLWQDHALPDGDRVTPLAWLQELVAAIRDALPEAWAPGGAPLPDTPRFQDAYAGLVAVADWVASTREALGEPGFDWTADPAGRMAQARATADRLISKIGLATDFGPQINPRHLDVRNVVGHAPNALQQAVMKAPLGHPGSLILIEALTGSGKTEAALLHFLRLWSNGEVAGLYFALPTRTSAVQVHERITALLQRLLGAMAPPVVLAVPGYLRVDDLRARPDAHVDGPGARGWSAQHPARFMTAPIVVGTVDQAFMSTIAVKHAHLRASLLSRHMLVIDKVHASDAYMTRIGTELVDRHRAVGGHVTLLSATCGGALAARFLGTARPDLQTAERRPYPAITWTANGQTPRLIRVPWRRRRTVQVLSEAIMEDPEQIAARALEAARRGAKVLTIVNTVTRATEIQLALEAQADQLGCRDLLFQVNGAACAHHSRYAAEDRRLLDARVTAALGRGRPAGGLVVVATQTMEQSIDVDADFLISDLCPMDVLLQRLGRLHRHDGAVRPRGYKRPKLLVVLPQGDLVRFMPGLKRTATGTELNVRGSKHGLGSAYLDVRVLEATRRALVARSRLQLPRDSRTLVEQATHQESLDQLVRALGSVWAFHSGQLDEIVLAATNQAGSILRDVDHAYNDPRKPAAPLDPAAVKTRLGDPDVVAVFRPRVQGPFGQKVSRLSIPYHLGQGIAPGDRPHVLDRRTPGRVIFQLGFHDAQRTEVGVFVYDRHGLRRHDPQG